MRPQAIDRYPEERHPLLEKVATAFDGRLDHMRRPETGFRVRGRGREKPQLCAVYWGDVHDNHCLEIAVAREVPMGRLSGTQVEHWIEREIQATGRRGKRHSNLDWPTLGFEDEDQVGTFLERVTQVRKGELHPDAMEFSGAAPQAPTAARSLARSQNRHAPGTGQGNGHGASGTSALDLLAAFRAKTGGAPGSTVAQRKTKQRIGQTLLRRALLEIWDGRCAVTGLSVRRLLRTSHIKSWAESLEVERLNPENCLLLAPHLDAAFDSGFISFDDEGVLLVSRELTPENRKLLGLEGEVKLSRSPSAQQRAFLAWHRQHRFRRGGDARPLVRRTRPRQGLAQRSRSNRNLLGTGVG